jgi:Tfp pilus assembly protein PilN
MRDIRVDLQERLDGLGADRQELQRRLTEIDRIEEGIKALLQRETVQFAASVQINDDGEISDGGSTELARLVLQTLRQHSQPLSLEAIKEAAEAANFDFGEKSPGRVLHWALVGMAQGGGVEKVNGKWQIKEAS